VFNAAMMCQMPMPAMMMVAMMMRSQQAFGTDKTHG
jgi:hypothetical protein